MVNGDEDTDPTYEDYIDPEANDEDIAAPILQPVNLEEDQADSPGRVRVVLTAKSKVRKKETDVHFTDECIPDDTLEQTSRLQQEAWDKATRLWEGFGRKGNRDKFYQQIFQRLLKEHDDKMAMPPPRTIPTKKQKNLSLDPPVNPAFERARQLHYGGSSGSGPSEDAEERRKKKATPFNPDA